MSALHLHQTTTATPEQFVAGLTDFGPDRSTIFPNSQDQNLTVHARPRPRPMSPRAPAQCGSGCTTTGPTRTGSW